MFPLIKARKLSVAGIDLEVEECSGGSVETPILN